MGSGTPRNTGDVSVVSQWDFPVHTFGKQLDETCLCPALINNINMWMHSFVCHTCGAGRGCWPRAVLSAAPPAAPLGSTPWSAGLPRCDTCAGRAKRRSGHRQPSLTHLWGAQRGGDAGDGSRTGWVPSSRTWLSIALLYQLFFPSPPQSYGSGKEPPQEGQDLQNQTGEALLPLLLFRGALGSPAGLGCRCAGVQLCGRLGVHDHGCGAVPPP